MADKDEMAHYDGPAGGWGSLKGIASIFLYQSGRQFRAGHSRSRDHGTGVGRPGTGRADRDQAQP